MLPKLAQSRTLTWASSILLHNYFKTKRITVTGPKFSSAGLRSLALPPSSRGGPCCTSFKALHILIEKTFLGTLYKFHPVQAHYTMQIQSIQGKMNLPQILHIFLLLSIISLHIQFMATDTINVTLKQFSVFWSFPSDKYNYTAYWSRHRKCLNKSGSNHKSLVHLNILSKPS